MIDSKLPCCGTCSRSCGDLDNLYCPRVARKVDKYECCMIYEAKAKAQKSVAYPGA